MKTHFLFIISEVGETLDVLFCSRYRENFLRKTYTKEELDTILDDLVEF